ncbi:MAG: hypothetical protein JW839_20530 [Candidatus Lokiarchaeota archaeon]|nr:hypothetical protein [Candidatus Lokiarchaeota archaeon]
MEPEKHHPEEDALAGGETAGMLPVLLDVLASPANYISEGVLYHITIALRFFSG